MPTELQLRLRELHDHYAYEVNSLIGEGREAEIDALVAGYPDEAARLIAEFEAAETTSV